MTKEKYIGQSYDSEILFQAHPPEVWHNGHLAMDHDFNSFFTAGGDGMIQG